MLDNLQAREKWLAAGVAGLLLVLGVRWGAEQIGGLYGTRGEQVAALEQQVARQELAVRRGRQEASRRAAWRRQSLPAERELARSLYQNWLLSRLADAGLDDVQVTSKVSRGRRDLFDRLAFDVTAEGDLAKLVRFLDAFYRADHLHQVRRLNIDPRGDGATDKLDLLMSVEALALTDADRVDTLSSEVSARLERDTPDAYVEAIVGRNLFAAYVPPPPPPKPKPKPTPVVKRPPPPPPKPRYDAAAQYAFVTGIVTESGRPQVWLHVRTTGETLKLRVGDDFEIGDISAKVADIRNRRVLVIEGDRRLWVELGESLGAAARAADEEI